MKIPAAQARSAFLKMASASFSKRNRALQTLVTHLRESPDALMQANTQDLAWSRAVGIAEEQIGEILLNEGAKDLVEEVEKILFLPDPIGELFDQQILSAQLTLAKERTPIGVLGMFDPLSPREMLRLSALSIKSGNCAVLRGRKEARKTNEKLVELTQKALFETALPMQAIQLLSVQEWTHADDPVHLQGQFDMILHQQRSPSAQTPHLKDLLAYKWVVGQSVLNRKA